MTRKALGIALTLCAHALALGIVTLLIVAARVEERS